MRIAWFHPPKTGTSFGTSLAHLANASLPPNAAMPYCGRDGWLCKGATGDFFKQRYPLNVWFKGIFWDKGRDPGEHRAVTDDVLQQFDGALFGMFRDPISRTQSAFSYQNLRFNGSLGRTYNLLQYAQHLRGMVTKMLAGQEDGNDCRVPGRKCNTQVLPDVRKAIARLSAFRFVGLTEFWNESVCLLHLQLGGRCLSVELQNNRKTGATMPDIDHKMRRALRAADPYDWALYQAAERVFQRNAATVGLSCRACLSIGCPALRLCGADGHNVTDAAGDTHPKNVDGSISGKVKTPAAPFAVNDKGRQAACDTKRPRRDAGPSLERWSPCSDGDVSNAGGTRAVPLIANLGWLQISHFPGLTSRQLWMYAASSSGVWYRADKTLIVSDVVDLATYLRLPFVPPGFDAKPALMLPGFEPLDLMEAAQKLLARQNFSTIMFTSHADGCANCWTRGRLVVELIGLGPFKQKCPVSERFKRGHSSSKRVPSDTLFDQSLLGQLDDSVAAVFRKLLLPVDSGINLSICDCMRATHSPYGARTIC